MHPKDHFLHFISLKLLILCMQWGGYNKHTWLDDMLSRGKIYSHVRGTVNKVGAPLCMDV